MRLKLYRFASGGGITLETVEVGADKVTGLATVCACLVRDHTSGQVGFSPSVKDYLDDHLVSLQPRRRPTAEQPARSVRPHGDVNI